MNDERRDDDTRDDNPAWTPPTEQYEQPAPQSPPWASGSNQSGGESGDQSYAGDPYSQSGGHYGQPGYGQSSDAGYGYHQPYSHTATGSGSGSKGGWFWKGLAIALVAALVGGGVGAAVVEEGKDDGPVRSSLTSSGANSKEISQPATPSNIRTVLQTVEPAVVSIRVATSSGTGSGTGMIISSDGYILTNAHVISGATNIKVTLSGQKDSIDARLIGLDRSIDSAVVKLSSPPANLPVVQFGDSDQMQVGDEVVAIGNALGLAGGPSVTTGILSARDRDIGDGQGETLQNLLQTDAAINPGNSGGPLVNMAGQVVGMNTAVIRGDQGEFENIGFALAINTIRPAITDLQAGKIQQRALLGVTADSVTEEVRQRLEITPQKGAIVDRVSPNGPADEAGLSRFDVIVGVDDKEITSSEQLVSEIRSHKPGDKVRIDYYRGSDKRSTTATLDAAPDDN